MISATRSRRWIALVAPMVLLLGLGATARRTVQAAHPGQNGKIVFSSFPRTSSPWEEIYTITPKGTNRTRLTHNNGNQVSDVTPAWNAAGDEIAFARFASGTDGEILSMDDNGNITGQLTTNKHFELSPSWSPDGMKIAFQRDYFGAPEADIFVKDLTTGNVVQITSDAESDERPVWSPNGDQIAFVRAVNAGARYELYTVDIDPVTLQPSNEVNLTNLYEPTASDYSPDWSPDGTMLTFSRHGAGWGQDGEIAVMEVANGNTTRITTDPRVDFDPAFSPNGAKLVWARGPEEQDTELVTTLASGGAAITVLTSNQVVDQQPDWQPR
jgi:TolB protein